MLESVTLKCQNHLIIISYYHVLEQIKDIIPPATYVYHVRELVVVEI